MAEKTDEDLRRDLEAARARVAANTANTIGDAVMSLADGARLDHERDAAELEKSGFSIGALGDSATKALDRSMNRDLAAKGLPQIDFEAAEQRRKRFEAEKEQRERAERFGRIVDGYAACGLPATYVRGERSLDTYDPQTDSQIEALSRVVAWTDYYVGKIRNRPESATAPPAWLYLWGEQPGVGKTHLAASSLAEYIRQGGTGRFVTVADLVLWARLDTQNAAEAVQACRRAQMLVLDDLGAEKMTEFSVAILGQILNTRAEAIRPTIITSNFAISGVSNRFEVQGEEIAAKRIASRIAGMTVGRGAGVLEIIGKDMR